MKAYNEINTLINTLENRSNELYKAYIKSNDRKLFIEHKKIEKRIEELIALYPLGYKRRKAINLL